MWLIRNIGATTDALLCALRACYPRCRNHWKVAAAAASAHGVKVFSVYSRSARAYTKYVANSTNLGMMPGNCLSSSQSPVVGAYSAELGRAPAQSNSWLCFVLRYSYRLGVGNTWNITSDGQTHRLRHRRCCHIQRIPQNTTYHQNTTATVLKNKLHVRRSRQPRIEHARAPQVLQAAGKL